MDLAQLPHLVRLWDDPSPAVHKAVLEALATYGEDLGDYLARLPDPPEDSLRQQIVDTVRSRGADASVAVVDEEDESSSIRERRFRPGQLTRHRRYGYRGVVVHCDPSCMADEEWYRSNQTQPAKEQPWYHVLVDGSQRITYVAQTNLILDESEDEVDHPLVEHFFSGFEDGSYVRNKRPWPRL
jgi:heat shock protein HspQ